MSVCVFVCMCVYVCVCSYFHHEAADSLSIFFCAAILRIWVPSSNQTSINPCYGVKTMHKNFLQHDNENNKKKVKVKKETDKT